MIPLSTSNYLLEGVSQDFFWKELDTITVGQKMDPEFGYTTPFFGNFNNVFGGRRVGNSFSVFLYRPVTQLVRTEILAKGTVTERSSGILVNCRFEYPFWSLLMLLVLGAMVFLSFYPVSLVNTIVASLSALVIYSLVVFFNHANMKKEMSRQLQLIEQKATLKKASI